MYNSECNIYSTEMINGGLICNHLNNWLIVEVIYQRQMLIIWLFQLLRFEVLQLFSVLCRQDFHRF